MIESCCTAVWRFLWPESVNDKALGLGKAIKQTAAELIIFSNAKTNFRNNHFDYGLQVVR